MKIIDRIIIDNKAPNNKNVIWIDMSKSKPVQRYYLNGKWNPLNIGQAVQQNNAVLKMYIPNEGTYSKQDFESMSGISEEDFIDAATGKYVMIEKVYSSFQTDSVTPSEQPSQGSIPGIPSPVIVIDQDQGTGGMNYLPISSYINISTQIYQINALEKSGSYQIIYHRTTQNYEVSYLSY